MLCIVSTYISYKVYSNCEMCMECVSAMIKQLVTAAATRSLRLDEHSTQNKAQSRMSFALCRRASPLPCWSAGIEATPETSMPRLRCSHQIYAFVCLVCPIPSRGILYVCFILCSVSLKVLFLHKFEFPAHNCTGEEIWNEIWFILYLLFVIRGVLSRRHQQPTACATQCILSLVRCQWISIIGMAANTNCVRAPSSECLNFCSFPTGSTIKPIDKMPIAIRLDVYLWPLINK